MKPWEKVVFLLLLVACLTLLFTVFLAMDMPLWLALISLAVFLAVITLIFWRI